MIEFRRGRYSGHAKTAEKEYGQTIDGEMLLKKTVTRKSLVPLKIAAASTRC